MSSALRHAPRVLCVSFDKISPEDSFLDLEKLLVFQLTHLFNFYTPMTFLDYAIPANRLTLNPSPDPLQNAPHVQALGQQLQCSHVLHVSMEPDVGPANTLESITLQVTLFETAQGQPLFQLPYSLMEFEDRRSKVSRFTPSWRAFEAMTHWLLLQISGAVLPQHVVRLWEKLQKIHLAPTMAHLQALTQAHYIQGHDALPQKFSLLVNLINEQPDVFLAHLELGYLQKRMRNYPQAVAALERAYEDMKTVSGYQRAFCATELGICYALWENQEQAQHWWKKAMQDDPTYVNPYLNLAHALEEQDQLEEAEFYFLKVGEIAPDDHRVYFNLARLYTKQEAWDKAIAQYEYQLTLDPQNAWIYSNMANCYLHKGDIARAKNYLLKTMDADPEGEAGRCAHFILAGLQAVEV